MVMAASLICSSRTGDVPLEATLSFSGAYVIRGDHEEVVLCILHEGRNRS
jgi:hypothetical protein